MVTSRWRILCKYYLSNKVDLCVHDNLLQSLSTERHELGVMIYFIEKQGEVGNTDWEFPLYKDLTPLDPLLAHLIRNLTAAEPRRKSTDWALNHPFFWSDEDRISFIETLRSILFDDKAKDVAAFLTCLHGYSREVFGGGWTWFEKLPKNLKEAVRTRKIEKTQSAEYNERSIRSLVKCVRDSIVHYETLPVNIRSELGTNRIAAFRFLLERFPKLFESIYICSYTHLKDNATMKNFFKKRS